MFWTTRGAAEKHNAQAKGSALTPHVRGERKMLVNYISHWTKNLKILFVFFFSFPCYTWGVPGLQNNASTFIIMLYYYIYNLYI